MKINDNVLYKEHGKDYIATVLEIRNLDNHLGANGEPLLHLGFFSPVFKPGPNGIPTRSSLVGTHQQYDLAQFRVDVAHESHNFDPKLKLPTYPGGRWREVKFSELSNETPEAVGSGSEKYGGATTWTDSRGAGLTDDTRPSFGTTDSGLPVHSGFSEEPTSNDQPLTATHDDQSTSDGAADEVGLGDATTEGTIH